MVISMNISEQQAKKRPYGKIGSQSTLVFMLNFVSPFKKLLAMPLKFTEYMAFILDGK